MSGVENFVEMIDTTEKQRQEQALRQKEPELERLAGEKKEREFFDEIIPLLRSLKSYIKRRLRIAYLTLQIRTQVATSGDILDEVILYVYSNYSRKPEDLTLEQWLYQTANRKLKNYISKQKSREKRRTSTERLSRSELSTLEEMPITADADGEPWLPEDLDDSEYQPRDFEAPPSVTNPEAELERKEKFRQILDALCRVPEKDRLVFDLIVTEGFSTEAAAKILNIPPDEIPKIVERTKTFVRKQIERSRSDPDARGRAS